MRPSITVWPTLLLLLLLASLPRLACAETLLKTRAAWDGQARPGRAAELAIAVISETGGEAQLSLQHSMFRVDIPLMIQAGVPLESLSTLPVVDSEAVVVELVAADGSVIRQSIRFDLFAEPLVIDRPSASAFPYSTAGYDTIDLLVLDRDTLVGLHKKQLDALRQYVGSCGRVVFAYRTTGQRWPETLSCGGSNTIAVDDSSQLSATIKAMLKQPRYSYPSAISLAGFLSNPLASMSRWLAFFFSFYLLVFAAIYATRGSASKTLPSVLITSVAASIVLWSGLMLWGDVRHGVIWAEIHEGGQVATSSSLALSVAAGRSQQRLGDDAIPVSVDRLMIRQEEDGKRIARDMRPLALHTVFVKRTGLPVSTLDLSYEDGLPVISNKTQRPVEGAYLLYSARVYAIPVIQPFARWFFEKTTPVATSTAATKLMRKRAGNRDALLVGLHRNDQPQSQHWVLLKSKSVVTGALK